MHICFAFFTKKNPPRRKLDQDKIIAFCFEMIINTETKKIGETFNDFLDTIAF